MARTLTLLVALSLPSAHLQAQTAGAAGAQARATSFVELGTLLVIALGGLAALKLRRRST